MSSSEDPLQAKKVRELFEQAFDLSDTERDEFLREVCADDAKLLEQVKVLLNQEGEAKSRLSKIEEELIWPSLHSFKEDPTILEDWLGGSEGLEPEDDALIGKTISHFTILEQIGRGGMGMVYKAHDQLLERTVALKFLPPAMGVNTEAKERFLREAKVSCEIDHPNIATVYEIGETEDQQMFIAMGYYQGESLSERISKGALPLEEAIQVTHQLARALEIVHENDIIHRDIKPGNLIITDDNTVKLLDFGLAKLSFESGYTQIGQMVGTVAYMSPEQARGEKVGRQTDIWALGIVLYEMLTGGRPFDGSDAPSTMHAILEKDLVLPKEFEGTIPRAVQEILGRCLAKEPGKRYQSATDLITDLGRVMEGQGPVMRGGMMTWDHRIKRRKAFYYGGIGFVITLALAIAYWGNARSSNSSVRFVPVTEGAIVEELGAFADLAFGDYDNDGWMDIAVTNQDDKEAVYLYHNDQKGGLERVTEGEPASSRGAGMSPRWADQDNDGDLDLFVCTESGNDMFFRNTGDGTFEKVLDGDWLNNNNSGNNACWGDYDNDGYVDLYVANFGTPESEINNFYRNTGDGSMEAVHNESTGLKGMSHGCLFTDYDNDGDLDLFVGGQDKVQFRNDGEGQMTWVPPEEGGIPRSTVDVDVGFYSADYDNDGDLDVIYTTWNTEPSFLFYRNEGGSRFVHVPHAIPSAGPLRTMCAAWGDYDNDGFVDVFITNKLGKNLLYRNLGNGSFERILNSPAVSEGHASTGAGFADMDNDGDLDLVVANGIWSPFDESCEMYLNSGNSNNWILFGLIGTVSNRSGIGAKVRINTSINGQKVAQLREICSGNNQTNLRAHFGLGDAEVVEQVKIEWPSGHVQELRNVEANQQIIITESL